MAVEKIADDARNDGVGVVHRRMLQIGRIGVSSCGNLSLLKLGLFRFRFDLKLVISGQVIVAAGHSDGRQLWQQFEGVKIWPRLLSRILFWQVLVLQIRQILVDLIDAEASSKLHLILNEILEGRQFWAVGERGVSGVEKLEKMLDSLDADVGKNQNQIFFDGVTAN